MQGPNSIRGVFLLLVALISVAARAQTGGLATVGTTLIVVEGEPFPPIYWVTPLSGPQAWASLVASPSPYGEPIVATFTGSDPDPSSYSISISWGDGSPSAAGSAQPDGDGGFWALGASTYFATGVYPISVSIVDPDGGTAMAQSTAFVLDDLLTLNSATASAVEGVPVSLLVATLTGPSPRAANYQAFIDWGDGTSSGGHVSPGVAPGFDVNGLHAYATAGTFAINVLVTYYEQAGGFPPPIPVRAAVASSATISDAPLSGTDGGAFQAFQGVPYAGEVTTFSDANPYGTWADYAATIDWGDGDAGPSMADRIAPIDGGFAVFGVHTYQQLGRFTVGVAIIDGAGSSTFASATATVVPAPDGGPPPDAGMEDAGSLMWITDDGGPLAFGDGGTTAASAGCGCRSGGPSSAGPWALGLLTLILVARARRRVAEVRR